MKEKPTYEELENRLMVSLRKYEVVPKDVSTCWYGYLGALLEWGVLSIPDHTRLTRLLPEVDHNPIVDIMLGK